jgi:hypothetical protein
MQAKREALALPVRLVVRASLAGLERQAWRASPEAQVQQVPLG